MKSRNSAGSIKAATAADAAKVTYRAIGTFIPTDGEFSAAAVSSYLFTTLQNHTLLRC